MTTTDYRERIYAEKFILPPERTPDQIRRDALRGYIAALSEALNSVPSRRERPKPITTREMREARRLRHSGLTWEQVGQRMGTNKHRARTAAQKTVPLKEHAA